VIPTQDLDTARETEEKINDKRVAARLLPSLGGSLGARVILLEVAGGMRTRAFLFSFSCSGWGVHCSVWWKGGGVSKHLF